MRQIIRLQLCVYVCLLSCSYVAQCRRSCSWKTLRAAAAPAPGLATGVMQRDTRELQLREIWRRLAAVPLHLFPLPLCHCSCCRLQLLSPCLKLVCRIISKVEIFIFFYGHFELLPPLVAESVCNACLGPFGVACLLLLANSTNWGNQNYIRLHMPCICTYAYGCVCVWV